jgi:hypothetical protein
MASNTYGQYAVKGINTPFVTYRTDFRVGRIDFQIRNYGDNPVKVQVQESEVDGTGTVVVAGDTLINVGGGVVDLAINVAKGQVQLLSGSGNTANSNIYLQAQFFGHTFYGGNVGDMESLTASGWTTGGVDAQGRTLPGGVRD